MTTTSPPDPAVVVTDAMLTVDHAVTHLPTKTALQLLEFCRRRINATESRLLADRYDNGDTDRDIEDLSRQDGQTSKADAKKRARRAKATNANPDLADKLDDGTLSTEQADIIAEAAEDTEGEAACDTELIDTVAGTTPEQGKKKVRDYVNKRRNANDVQKHHDKQHRLRGVYRHRLANGNAALTFHGTTAHIDEIERHIHAQSNAEYQADGGRDVPRHKHPRTRDQRNFDAAHRLATRTTAEGSKRPSNRQAVIFITASVDQLNGSDTSPITTVDGKPLPRSMVEQLAGDAAFIAQVFSKNGELLWQGRKHRLATPAQINGLISRDKGCTQCGAHPDKCVAHHLLPWEAPSKGPTNINNLALLCTDCHTRLHRNQQTMYYDIASQTWRIRPANSDEIPPSPPTGSRHDPPGQYKRRRRATRPERTTQTSKPRLDERQPLPGIRW